MLNRSTTWALVFLVATFAAGMAVGAGGRALWVRHASAAAPERRGLDRMMDELNAELRLGPVQRDSMRAQMDSEVARELSPEQKAKYRDHVTRYRHQKEQEKTDTGSGGQKK